ncbi:hypothetical protein IMX26_16830 [Clostridium sp. 'deep sea']|uniref:hypothetical protein n=1 Tax=Clostridium sp. 'deep sea' TaxID=2779445 RepID=UPI0018965BBB|nr:hypothetical protein [Clostridium sp. 'deep sea']QOR35100.1 hypothetical protein IMX26_16830 [Clostridium sp. 'deep sea']
MHKIFSDLIENAGTSFFSLANKKATNQNTFNKINKLNAKQITNIYQNIKVFNSYLATSKVDLIKTNETKNIKYKTYKTKSLYEPVANFSSIYNELVENHYLYYDLLRHKSVNTTDLAIIYIHGFSMRNYGREYKLFSKLINSNKDLSVYATQLPYHMNRSPLNQPYSGAYTFDSCPLCSIEAIRQAVHDISQLISIIKNKHKKIIVGGFSLGGYVTSLLATCDNRADLYIVGQADSDLPTCMNDTPVCPGLQKNKSIWTNNKENFQSLYEPLNLLKHKPAVKGSKVVSVAGKYDKLINYNTVLKLRKFFNSKYNIDYKAGHIGFLLEAKPVLSKLIDAIEHEVKN